MAVIKTISFGRTFNDGNYESTRIDISAEVGPKDDYEQIFLDLVEDLDELRELQLNTMPQPTKRSKRHEN